MGHAARGRARRIVFCGASAPADSCRNQSPVCRRPHVTPLEYDFLRRLLKERSGLVLAADKQYLVESRLLPIARRVGAVGLGGLVLKLNAANAEGLASEVVEAMTPNETFFFRDKTPFDQFANVIMPALIAARARERRIRIWSAAASTGQEPYSL